jgi:heme exporter protein C
MSSTIDAARRRLVVLGGTTAAVTALAIIGLFLIAPEDTDQGVIQRIFYFHVPVALVSLVAFGVACVAGIMYLRRGSERWDEIGVVSVGLGLLFSILTVVTGSIWAKASWGTWWVWEDPRLVTYLVVILIYAAYFVLRSSAEEGRRGRFSAIYAIIGFVGVPLSFYSVRVAESFVHPVVFTRSGANMPNSMLIWFVASLVAMLGVYATLLQMELLQRRADRAMRDLKDRLESMMAGV